MPIHTANDNKKAKKYVYSQAHYHVTYVFIPFKLIYTDENWQTLKIDKCYSPLLAPVTAPPPKFPLKIYPFPPITRGESGAPRIPHSV